MHDALQPVERLRRPPVSRNRNARRWQRRAHVEVTSIIAIAHSAQRCSWESKPSLLSLPRLEGRSARRGFCLIGIVCGTKCPIQYVSCFMSTLGG